MRIRKAEKDDLASIIEIEAMCFPKTEAATPKDLTKRFETFMDCFVVAEEQGKVIGFINGSCFEKPELLDELYHDTSLHNSDAPYQMVFGLDVLEAYRQQGVGEALLNFFIELAKQRNKKGMVLTCKDYLVHYYEKFGFVHQGISNSTHGGVTWNDMVLTFE